MKRQINPLFLYAIKNIMRAVVKGLTFIPLIICMGFTWCAFSLTELWDNLDDLVKRAEWRTNP